jgi:hypothetical protein
MPPVITESARRPRQSGRSLPQGPRWRKRAGGIRSG